MTPPPCLILGARSDIGLAVAHQFAAQGHPIQLAARNSETLAADRADIELRHQVAVTLHEFDALATDAHPAFIASLPEPPEIAVCVVGLLGRQDADEQNASAATLVLRSNFEGPAQIMAVLADTFASRGRGTLVGVSSVAGERGRATNYIYGSAKAGFTAFLSGLRNRLATRNVHVVTVLPGFVATRMTEGLATPQLLTANPSEVARAIETAIRRKRNVVYVRPIWRWIMLVIRNIPEQYFKRMRV